MDVKFKSISSARKALLSQEISVKELLQPMLNLVATNENNEFITSTAELALAKAEESQRRINNGEALKLDGIPCAIKDLFCTKGTKTTAGSKMLANFVPPYESTVTSRLFDEGAIMVGKTNMDEFAMGSTTENSYFNRCTHPTPDKATGKRILHPGGSSGGSAVSVATGSSMFATASDTGGSTRQPAALCGIVGMKPTYGICSRFGMIPFSSSFDQAGVMARTVEDVATVLECIAGHDVKDSTTARNDLYSKADFKTATSVGSVDDKSLKDLKIAVIDDASLAKINPSIADSVRKAAKMLATAGASVSSNVTVPYLDEAIMVYYVVTPAECFSNLAKYDGIRYGHSNELSTIEGIEDLYIQNRTEAFGKEVKRRISLGSVMLSAENYDRYFTQATKVRRMISDGFEGLFKQFDAILMPTTADVAKDPSTVLDPVEVYMNDYFTIPASCAGLPAISIPFGVDPKSNLPIGMQIVSAAFQDAKVLRVAATLETLYRAI